MPGLDPGSRGNEVPAAASGFVETAIGIHDFLAASDCVDGRVKPGHDVEENRLEMKRLGF
jgi:hypothetical protein